MHLLNSTEFLFYHLAKTSPKTGAPCQNINVPRSIFYRWGKAVTQFYTDPITKTVQIEEENGLHLDPATLRDIFSSKNDSNTNENLVAHLVPWIKGNGSNNSYIEFKYLKLEELIDEISFRNSESTIIVKLLHEVIPPKHGHSSRLILLLIDMIKVSWSNQFLTISKKVNINHINSKDVSLEERMSTFEGKEHNVETSTIHSSLIKRQIETLISSIIDHISWASGKLIRLVWMTLYIQEGSDGNLWLLYVSRLKIRTDVHSPVHHRKIKIKRL